MGGKMQAVKVNTITSNDQHIRLSIHNGELQIDDYAKEAIRLLEAQNKALVKRLNNAGIPA